MAECRADARRRAAIAYQPGRVQINERSLRLTATDLSPLDRAESYYRFPEGEKNFMGYKELRVWARGVSSGWGSDGELQFYVKIARDSPTELKVGDVFRIGQEIIRFEKLNVPTPSATPVTRCRIESAMLTGQR